MSEEVHMIRKTFDTESKAVDVHAGIYEVMITTETVDRDGDIVRAAGAERVGREIEADFETDVQEYLQDAAELIGVTCVTVIGNGDEVTEILTASQDRPAAIIVMASQGQSGLTKWRLGSITDRVIRETTRPVVVVPPILAR